MFHWLTDPLFLTPLVLVPFVFKCLLLAMAHHLGDFAFQNDWMAGQKGKSWEVLCYHVLMYTVVFVPLAFVLPRMNLAAALVIFGTHFVIDACKARWKIVRQIWQDQLLHFGVLGGLLAMGWL